MIKQPGVLDWALQEWTEKGAGPLATGVTGTTFLSYFSVLPPSAQDSLEIPNPETHRLATGTSESWPSKAVRNAEGVAFERKRSAYSVQFWSYRLNY
jgi:hypothetical protein